MCSMVYWQQETAFLDLNRFATNNIAGSQQIKFQVCECFSCSAMPNSLGPHVL